jgi:Mlc titration factor MtfA (ptsG expression regulator)
LSAEFAVAIAASLAVLAWLVGQPLLAARRRKALAARGLSAGERALLAGAWPAYARVPAVLAARLDALTAVFVGEKSFVGCRGLEVTPAMRLSIAAQACLLVLGHERRPYENLRSVLVYPSQFVVPDRWHDEDGVVTEEELVLSGEAQDVSRILLSWEDVVQASHGEEPYNVVIHEFAHYLDLEDGEADGIPRFGTRTRRTTKRSSSRSRARRSSSSRAGSRAARQPSMPSYGITIDWIRPAGETASGYDASHALVCPAAVGGRLSRNRRSGGATRCAVRGRHVPARSTAGSAGTGVRYRGAD